MKVIEWKPIKGFDGYYEVSNTGEVRSLDQSNVCLCCNGKRNTVGGFKWEYAEKGRI